MRKRTSFFILLFLSSLILLSFFSGCLFKPPVTEGVLKGQVIVPEGTLQEKDLTGQALPNATINIIDPATGAIIATATTDANGYYQVFVPAGGPYLLGAIKEGVKLQQVTPQVEVGIEYELGTADCSTTSVALIAQAMVDAEDYPDNLADINLADIAADPDFNDVMNPVCGTIEAGGDPTELAVVQQAVEDFLYPPTPAPPAPTPLTAIAAISGTAKVGEILTAGALTPSGATATYQWQICTTAGGAYANISGATSTIYTPVAGDVTKFIKVAATGTGNYSGTVTSTATTAVTAATYTVTFNANGGSGTMADQTIASGSSANLTACGFTKTGWTFAGWATTPGGDVEYADHVSYTMGIADVTLYAKWTPPDTYSLRDIGPAGGWIFYDDEADGVDDIVGARYLEAAPVSTEWPDKEWGSFETLIGGTETGIGTGQSNTTTIVTWLDNNTDDTYGDVTSKTDRAAYLCHDLSYGGYDDWFLPSKDELNKMWVNLKKGEDENIVTYDPVGGFAEYYYWSSSENFALIAWFQSFGDGSQFDSFKNDTLGVRAVRAF